MRAQIARLANGRLHLNDGPIDLVIGCDGARPNIEVAENAAIQRFSTILDELCAELALLRRAAGERPRGAVARRMWRATLPFAGDTVITPMAAVAGAVAEEIVETMTGAAPLARCMVNNGGDIAFSLADGERIRLGLIDRPDRPTQFANTVIRADQPVRGVATSGWRGRSFSLGIADAVTVLAATASAADAAATLIANAVDLPGHPAVNRQPAVLLQPDSDLGNRLVTTDVGDLTGDDVARALAAGARLAGTFLARGLIAGCALHLCRTTRIVDAEAQPAERLLAHA